MIKKITHTSLEEFYGEMAKRLGKDLESIFPTGLHKNIGHFNVFYIAQILATVKRL